MKELVRLRENQPELPIVVCGDMNSNRRSLVREYMLHGMPELRDGALPAQGAFSDVWMREFNKKQEKPKEGGGAIDWTDDCFPWQSLWFQNCRDDEPLLPSKNLVPLLDAYQDLHDGKLAYTVPGEKNERSENMVLDHMYAAVLADLQLSLADTRFSFHTPELAPIIGHQDTVRRAASSYFSSYFSLLRASLRFVCVFWLLLTMFHQIVPFHKFRPNANRAPNALVPSDHCPLVMAFKFTQDRAAAFVRSCSSTHRLL